MALKSFNDYKFTDEDFIDGMIDINYATAQTVDSATAGRKARAKGIYVTTAGVFAMQLDGNTTGYTLMTLPVGMFKIHYTGIGAAGDGSTGAGKYIF